MHHPVPLPHPPSVTLENCSSPLSGSHSGSRDLQLRACPTRRLPASSSAQAPPSPRTCPAHLCPANTQGFAQASPFFASSPPNEAVCHSSGRPYAAAQISVIASGSLRSTWGNRVIFLPVVSAASYTHQTAVTHRRLSATGIRHRAS